MGFLDAFRSFLTGGTLQTKTSDSFDQTKYNNSIDAHIHKFNSNFNLSTIEGIKSINPQNVKIFDSQSPGVPSRSEQILLKKATEYKKENNWVLAIECLRKANELMPHSFYAYLPKDYERLVDYLVQAGQYDEAKMEHKKLNGNYNAKIEYLKSLWVKFENKSEEYYNRVIVPVIEEERDREEYYWLLENMKQISPKSFGGYRRMKKSKTENYIKLVEKVKESGYDLSSVKFWI